MQVHIVVGGAALGRRNRNPAVAVFVRRTGEECDRSERRAAGRGNPPAVETGERGVPRHQAVAARLVECDHAGQRARAVRPRASAAHDFHRRDVFRRQRRPDHPAAEGIVLRHAVERDERPSCARWRDRAQRDALRRRIGGEAHVTAEERKSGHLFERRIEFGRVVEIVGRQTRYGKGIVADRIGWARRDDHRLDGRVGRVGKCKRRKRSGCEKRIAKIHVVPVGPRT